MYRKDALRLRVLAGVQGVSIAGSRRFSRNEGESARPHSDGRGFRGSESARLDKVGRASREGISVGEACIEQVQARTLGPALSKEVSPREGSGDSFPGEEFCFTLHQCAP